MKKGKTVHASKVMNQMSHLSKRTHKKIPEDFAETQKRLIEEWLKDNEPTICPPFPEKPITPDKRASFSAHWSAL